MMDATPQIRQREFRLAPLETLQKFVQKKGETLPVDIVHFLNGLMESRRGNVQGALDAFIAATESNPREWVYPLELGRLLMRTGETLAESVWFENALLSLRRAIEIEPAEPEAFLLLADAFEQLGQTREALANLRRASELLIQPTSRDKRLAHLGDISEDFYPDTWPLVLCEDVHFFRFKAHGDHERLFLESLCEDGRHVLCCVLWGLPPSEYPWNGQRSRIVEEGSLPRKSLSEALEPELLGILKLSSLEEFPYAVWKIL
jgi:tetratricopeptide (TPR) repeat protein